MISNDAMTAGMATFVAEVTTLVKQYSDEHVLTRRVAESLKTLLASDVAMNPSHLTPKTSGYALYPIHIAPDNSFCIASAVWGVGQGTPIHGHETWGVVGIYSGVERETRYIKPTAVESGPLRVAGDRDWYPGEVTVCCTTDDDVHQVTCGAEVPCVGIHVYGADIGALSRRTYDERTGAISWFTSQWS